MMTMEAGTTFYFSFMRGAIRWFGWTLLWLFGLILSFVLWAFARKILDPDGFLLAQVYPAIAFLLGVVIVICLRELMIKLIHGLLGSKQPMFILTTAGLTFIPGPMLLLRRSPRFTTWSDISKRGFSFFGIDRSSPEQSEFKIPLDHASGDRRDLRLALESRQFPA